MMIYNQTKFGCKRILSLGNMVKSVIFDHRSPQLILTLKMANQFFVLHDTPAHNDAPSYQVWLQTVYGSYHPDTHT